MTQPGFVDATVFDGEAMMNDEMRDSVVDRTTANAMRRIGFTDNDIEYLTR